MKLLNSKTIQKQKIKSPFIIYANFKNFLVPEKNGKENPDESYLHKYQNCVGCSYGYKLVCVDSQLSTPFKSYLGQDDVHKSVISVVKENKH